MDRITVYQPQRPDEFPVSFLHSVEDLRVQLRNGGEIRFGVHLDGLTFAMINGTDLNAVTVNDRPAIKLLGGLSPQAQRRGDTRLYQPGRGDSFVVDPSAGDLCVRLCRGEVIRFGVHLDGLTFAMINGHTLKLAVVNHYPGIKLSCTRTVRGSAGAANA